MKTQPDEPFEAAYLLRIPNIWTLIPVDNDDWPAQWNDRILPFLQTIWTTPFLKADGLVCRDPAGRVALLAHHIGLTGRDPDGLDPFHDAYPRLRLFRRADGASLLHMGFAPDTHPRLVRHINHWLEDQPWTYVFDPSLQCRTASKIAMSVLTGLGGRDDWPSVGPEKWDAR
jgi:hypothetical protein